MLLALLGLAAWPSLSASSSSMEQAVKDPFGGCTALAVSAGAMADGSTVVTHGNDCPTCDFRVVYVPARDYPPGSQMPVYMAKNDYPRFYGSGVSDSYLPSNTENPYGAAFTPSVPMGFIPQVSHTYAYLDGAYGLMSEHQLAIGESTCDARLGTKGVPIQFGGSALFDVAALSRVALQRCSTARCAVQLMGDLAEQYGFYGGQLPDWQAPGGMTDAGEGGEALTVADGAEAWVFEVSPDDTGKSAVWAAQRVPDGHITVITNTFNIGVIQRSDPDNFLFSSNLFDVAQRIGLFDPAEDETLDFTKVFRAPEGHSVAGHMLKDRRKWEVFRRACPSCGFDPYLTSASDDSDDYFPFSVPVDEKLSLEDVFSLHRDIFQNTPFDMSADMIAGPWGDPSRNRIPPVSPFNNSKAWQGGFERAVSQLWTSYTSVGQSRKFLPDLLGGRVWYGPHDALTTLFTPVYPGGYSVPSSMGSGSLNKADTQSLYWATCIVANYMGRWFDVLLPNVTGAAQSVEAQMMQQAAALEAKALLVAPGEQIQQLQAFHRTISSFALNSWWNFFFSMAGYLHDGTKFYPGVQVRSAGLVYPEWFVKLVGVKGAHYAEYANRHPDPQWETDSAPAGSSAMAAAPASGSPFGTLLTLVMGCLLGVWLAPFLRRVKRRQAYEPLA